jgi:hypothetical protein
VEVHKDAAAAAVIIIIIIIIKQVTGVHRSWQFVTVKCGGEKTLSLVHKYINIRT